MMQLTRSSWNRTVWSLHLQQYSVTVFTNKTRCHCQFSWFKLFILFTESFLSQRDETYSFVLVLHCNSTQKGLVHTAVRQFERHEWTPLTNFGTNPWSERGCACTCGRDAPAVTQAAAGSGWSKWTSQIFATRLQLAAPPAHPNLQEESQTNELWPQYTPIYLNMKTMYSHSFITTPAHRGSTRAANWASSFKRPIRNIINFFKCARKAATRGGRGAPARGRGSSHGGLRAGCCWGPARSCITPAAAAASERRGRTGRGRRRFYPPSLPASRGKGPFPRSPTGLPPAPLTVKARLRALLRELDGGHRRPHGRSPPALHHMPGSGIPSAAAGGARPARCGRLRGPGQRLWLLFERGEIKHGLEG